MKPVRAALYARCSTLRQEHSAPSQLHELREYASRRGWKVVAEFVDEGVSGAKSARPALDRMLDDVRRGRVDVVLVVRLDRLGRNLRHLLGVLEEIAAHGVAFASATEPIDTSTPAGKMVVAVLGAAAELERSLIAERVRAGVAAARRRGKRLGRPRAVVDHAVVLELVGAGVSRRAIAKQLGVGVGTVQRIVAERSRIPVAGELKNVPDSEAAVAVLA